MPAFARLSGSTAKPLLSRRWIPNDRVPIYILIASVAGLVFMFIAVFIPPIVWVQEGITGSGTYYVTVVLTIFYTPLPLLVNIIIGVISISLIPLAQHNSGRHRLIGAVIFAELFASAFFLEQIQIGILTDLVWQAYGQPPYFTPLITNPLLFILMATTAIVGISLGSIILSLITGFFGEYLWTTLKGPLHVEGTRRTSVVIKGGDRGTVLSIDHDTRRLPFASEGTRGSRLGVNLKGGYLRGMVRPSKWQAYDRED
ncbi:MAG: hypothetical protein ACFE8F_03100 [Promethearchaeota archaeon]